MEALAARARGAAPAAPRASTSGRAAAAAAPARLPRPHTAARLPARGPRAAAAARRGRAAAAAPRADSANRPTPEPEFRPNTEFGYSRKDVILIGAAIFAAGYGLYYGLQFAFGMEPGIAGNYVQLIVVLGLCLGWIGSYLWRVATKNMTYVVQLRDYEDAVMARRLEEMPAAEAEAMMAEVAAERAERGGGGGGGGGAP
jgi:hypothetical protein